MALYKNLTHQHIKVPIDVNNIQVLRLPSLHGGRVRDPKVDVVHDLYDWNEMLKNPYVYLV